MAYDPAYAMALLLPALLAPMASWGWLQFATYPMNANRDNAARFTSWLFVFVAICGALVLLTLSAPARSQTIVAPPPHTSTVNGFIITEGDITDRSYLPIGTVTAKAVKLFGSRNPGRSDVERKLREKAQQMGADAVVRVQYKLTGQSLIGTYGGFKAEGLAVKFLDPSASIPQRDEMGRHATKEQLAKMPPLQQTPSETLAPVKVARPETPQPSSVAPAIAAAAASSGPRYALIIGNGQYSASFGPLANPVNDAQAVAAALSAVGFDVDLVTDADQKAMKRAISRFGERLSSARGATGLFFYAGHGIQSRGTNYLIPVSAPIKREADLDLEAVAADTVLAQMEDAGASTSIVILDACRNMPLARSFRSTSRGLARMDAPNGSFIAYSTAPGSVAADGEGRNSPFAAAFVRQIGHKGLPIEVIFRSIRRDVVQATVGQQTPWDSSSLLDPFYFVP